MALNIGFWRLALSGALLGLLIGSVIGSAPSSNHEADSELIEDAYSHAVEKIFLAYCENLATMSDADALSRFKKGLAQVREARANALEIVK